MSKLTKAEERKLSHLREKVKSAYGISETIDRKIALENYLKLLRARHPGIDLPD